MRIPRRWAKLVERGLDIWILVGAVALATLSMAWMASILRSAEIRPMPLAEDSATGQSAVEYGRKLAFDKRLSRTLTHSCMTCHDPKLGYSDGKRVSEGATGDTERNSPTLLNAGFKVRQFHDGRADLLEGQASQPLQSVVEMGQDNVNDPVRRLNAIPGYRSLNAEVFGRETIQARDVFRALAAFQRTLVSTDAPIDRMLTWEYDDGRDAWNYRLHPAANFVGDDGFRRGFGVFVTNCLSCHQGPSYRDGRFHNVGWERGGDGGRAEIVNGGTTRGFATPTLREVQATAPYGHRGEIPTLADAVEAHCDPIRDRAITPGVAHLSRLTTGERASLVSFLQTAFAGKYPVIGEPELPPSNAEFEAVLAGELNRVANGNRRGLFPRRRR